MNIWYSEEEIKKINDLLKKLEVIKNNNEGNYQLANTDINQKYPKYLKYLKKDYWTDLKKVKELSKIYEVFKDTYENLNLVVHHLTKLNIFVDEEYGNILSNESYKLLYEAYITIRNIVTNLPQGFLLIKSYYIEKEIYKIYYDQKFNYHFNSVSNYQNYHNSEWYTRIKDYQSIEQIYLEALQESWPYEKFYHIINAFKLFKEIRTEQIKQQQEYILEEEQKLRELPVYLCLTHPDLITSFEKDILKNVKRELIKKLPNVNEQEENKIINSLYKINLIKKK